MKIRDLIIIITILCIDLFTKYIVSINFALYESIKVIDNFFYITFAKNTGAAWSLFSGRVGVLTLISLVGVLVFFFLYINTKEHDKFEKIAISLMIAGGLGNLLDRFILGYVRDFLHFKIFNYDFPIFNVADMSLCIGIAILFILTILKKDEFDGD
ncbi:MAG: signal peptidase II [Anaerorhabdus sp.]